MKILRCLLVLIICAALPTSAQQPKSLFYMTRDPNSVRSFLAHANKIDTLVPTWYSVDSNAWFRVAPTRRYSQPRGKTTSR
jgi:hypothetical protein